MRTPARKIEKPPVITIDGPSGSGKGAITHKLAQKLGFHILDSGALYRLIGLAARKSQTSFDDEPGLARISREMVVKFVPSDDPEEPLHILLEGEEVTKSLRTDQAGQDASRVAPIAAVRAGIGELQRGFLTAPGLIADGRDMGTVIFSDAMHKIFLTASIEERAKRRQTQLKIQGLEVNMRNLLQELEERDKKDMDREHSPLIPAKDSVMIDTSNLNPEGVVKEIKTYL